MDDHFKNLVKPLIFYKHLGLLRKRKTLATYIFETLLNIWADLAFLNGISLGDAPWLLKSMAFQSQALEHKTFLNFKKKSEIFVKYVQFWEFFLVKMNFSGKKRWYFRKMNSFSNTLNRFKILTIFTILGLPNSDPLRGARDCLLVARYPPNQNPPYATVREIYLYWIVDDLWAPSILHSTSRQINLNLTSKIIK